MTLIRSASLNGPGSWNAAQSVQVDSPTYTPSAIPNGVSGRMDWVSDPTGQCGTVLRSQLGAWTAESGIYGNRSEINFPSEPVSVGNPVCRWYKWAMMIPSEGFVATDRYFSVAQVHEQPDGGDGARWPNFVLYAGAGELRLMLPKVNPPADGDPASRVAARYPLVLDRWMNLQIGINLSIESGGWIEFSIDGNLVLKEYTHGTHYDDVVGPWFKLGIYNIFKHETPGEGVIARAYYTANEHHGPPFSAGAYVVSSMQTVRF